MSLLGHPAMANWVLSTGNMGEDSSEPGGRAEDSERGRTGLQPLAGLPMEELAKLARNVVSEEVPQELSEQLRQALLAQAGWLHYAGHQSFARHAVFVAESLNHKQLHSHPLLLQIDCAWFHSEPRRGRRAERAGMSKPGDPAGRDGISVRLCCLVSRIRSW